jgi:arylamine N-acetyltransferase
MVAVVAFRHAVAPDHWLAFVEKLGLPRPDAVRADAALLRTIVRSFSDVPYENATQLIMVHEGQPKPRSPEVLIKGYLERRTGGTCYDLAYALADLLDLYGFTTHIHRGWVGRVDRPMSDRTLALGNHAAITVEVGRVRFLCDPGMLFQAPIEISKKRQVTEGARETAVLSEIDSVNVAHVHLRNSHGYNELCRIDLVPLLHHEIDEMWRASFDPIIPAEYLYLNRCRGGELFSLSDRYITRRDRLGHTQTWSASWAEIGGIFGLPVDIATRAWELTPHARPSAIAKRAMRRLFAAGLSRLTARVSYFP